MDAVKRIYPRIVCIDFWCEQHAVIRGCKAVAQRLLHQRLVLLAGSGSAFHRSCDSIAYSTGQRLGFKSVSQHLHTYIMLYLYHS